MLFLIFESIYSTQGLVHHYASPLIKGTAEGLAVALIIIRHLEPGIWSPTWMQDAFCHSTKWTPGHLACRKKDNSLWVIGCKNLSSGCSSTNHWLWWAAADTVLLNLFSFSWTLKKACFNCNIGHLSQYFSFWKAHVFNTAVTWCFILSHYSSLQRKGVKQRKTAGHSRICS